MKKFFAFLLGLLTDAKDRPEVKAVLGFVTIVIAFVWLFMRGDVTGFLLIFGAGLALLGIKTVEDVKLDAGERGA